MGTTTKFSMSALVRAIAALLCLLLWPNAFAKDPVRVEIFAASMMGPPLVHVKVTNVTADLLRNVELRLKVPMKGSGAKYIEMKPSHLTSHSPGAQISYDAETLVARFPVLNP